MRRAALLAAVGALVGAAPAAAAPPANDTPAGAIEVAPVSAENGPVLERQGIAELTEATADAGVPRCLGRRSFERAVWFRVPAAPTPMRVRLDALATSGGPDETPDLAAYVQPGTPQTRIAQACDGRAAKPAVLRAAARRDGGAPGIADTGAAVELDVPAGQEVLVQVGRPVGSSLTRVLLAAGVDALPATAAPVGDRAGGARPYPLGRARLVPLVAATLTAEDPAVPACPAAATVWRRLRVTRTGRQVAAARGPGVGALTVFVGRRPTADNAVACGLGAPGGVAIGFRARRGQRAWIRVGTAGVPAPTARLAVSGPCDQTPLRPVRRTTVRAARLTRGARRLRLRLTLAGPCVRRARVTVRRGGIVVARGVVGTIVRGARTVRLRRVAGTRLTRGRVGVTVTGRGVRGRPVRLHVSARLR